MTESILEQPRASHRARRVVVWLMISVVVIGGACAWAWMATEQDRAIRAMSPDDRLAFYQRTLQNLQSVCAGQFDGRLQKFCREQAQLVVRFPECDEQCDDLAQHLLSPATR
jgi:hypothetical protein